ncbi:hypothetical protein L596_003829 [Steinernema carpocapsae]|uniref:Uncharacterized protein n=1 Tax=Steinernema carpocapsae TaxID=34508 RepID=A0A4U8UX61_STECR|nr:hypothetical protein L596_003829 [Steinernema carpocapsae]
MPTLHPNVQKWMVWDSLEAEHPPHEETMKSRRICVNIRPKGSDHIRKVPESKLVNKAAAPKRFRRFLCGLPTRIFLPKHVST